MAQNELSAQEQAPEPDSHPTKSLWRRLLGRGSSNAAAAGPVAGPAADPFAVQPLGQDDQGDGARTGLIRRVSRKVVPGLPRAQTFKRQQSELRDNLEPVQPTPAERRAVSVDRRMHVSQSSSQCLSNPRTSAPDFLPSSYSRAPSAPSVPSAPASPAEEPMMESIGELANRGDPVAHEPDADEKLPHAPDAESLADTASLTSTQFDQMIHDELESIWILNLSMHFRDKSKREKFFVTYRERDLWRRVTISLDYRNAPEDSLEKDLIHTKFQREKNAKIYEAIRESLGDIQFYDTVTNLKLQTTDGRLHVHVVEDVNEIIHYPTTRMIQHLRCRRVRERDIEFDSHMSGFVYKVRVQDELLIKKEIPGPDTVEEFLYEVNALNCLRHSGNVIQFYGVIVDDREEYVKGLLISYAEQGALIDIIYDNDHSLSWSTREKWARQIIEGLSEIHEAGFVQGDFTLSNIVIDDDNNAKIIDINRRGCPVGWEPPEATPLIENGQRISMYIGVKSDLYQLGMVLWALAMQEDEPESHGRPLRLEDDADVPQWYRTVVETCLAEDPRLRAQAIHLLGMFPGPEEEALEGWAGHDAPSTTIDDGSSLPDTFADGYPPNGQPRIRTVQPPPSQLPNDWDYVSSGHTYVDPATGFSNEPYFYPTRGRSPPSPLPSNHECDSPRRASGWSGYSYGQGDEATTTATTATATTSTESVSDTDSGEYAARETRRSLTPVSRKASAPALNETRLDEGAGANEASKEISVTESASGGSDLTAEAATESMNTEVTSEASDATAGAERKESGDDAVPVPEIRILAEPSQGSLEVGEPEMAAEPVGEGMAVEPAAVGQTEDKADGEANEADNHDAHGAEHPLPVEEAGNTVPELHGGSNRTKDKEPSGDALADTPAAGKGPSALYQTDSAEEHVDSTGEKDPPTAEEEGSQEPAPLPASSAYKPRNSLPLELPNELKGIGAAHDHEGEEAARGRGSFDEFSSLTTTATTTV